ncbi:unnamed protein product [Durusdinium trenchii]|uniref:Adenosine deaminase domain-containing protein n=1 Tax=Durusdinium trenchii TaxID=1381693 RepID=A0ABP0P475_9DINO
MRCTEELKEEGEVHAHNEEEVAKEDDDAKDMGLSDPYSSSVFNCLKGIWESGIGGEVLKIALDSVKSRIDRPCTRSARVELHLHLEGAMRLEPQTRRTRQRRGVAWWSRRSGAETLTELCFLRETEKQLDQQVFRVSARFASCYIAVCECLREKADLERLVLEVAEDASASGALWIEPALSIDLYADQFGGVEATLHLLFQAAEAAEEATQVAMGFIVAAERHLPVARAEALAKKVRDVVTSGAGIHGRPGILGFGLHSDEANHPPEPFAEAFHLACSDLVVPLPHAGEFAPTGGGAKSDPWHRTMHMGYVTVCEKMWRKLTEFSRRAVRFCVDHLKAVRIAHGVLAAEDQELVEHLAKLQVCLDVCPTSNELLGVMPVTESALTKLLAAGVPCTINSDDPLLFGSSLLGEFRRCRDELKMSDEQLAACADLIQVIEEKENIGVRQVLGPIEGRRTKLVIGAALESLGGKGTSRQVIEWIEQHPEELEKLREVKLNKHVRDGHRRPVWHSTVTSSMHHFRKVTRPGQPVLYLAENAEMPEELPAIQDAAPKPRASRAKRPAEKAEKAAPEKPKAKPKRARKAKAVAPAAEPPVEPVEPAAEPPVQPPGPPRAPEASGPQVRAKRQACQKERRSTEQRARCSSCCCHDGVNSQWHCPDWPVAATLKILD